MTIFIQDSFTGANGTDIQAHAPEVGSAYTRIFGGAAGELTINTNKLQRKAGGTGTLYFSNAAIIPRSFWKVQFKIRFIGNISCEVLLARNGSNFGNGDRFLTFSFQSTANSEMFSAMALGSINTSAIFTALNTDYTVRIEMANVGADTVQTIYVNDVLIATKTGVGVTDWFGRIWDDVGYLPDAERILGFGVYDSAGLRTIQLDDLLVESIVQPTVIAFEGVPVSGPAPLQVQFTDQTTPTPATWVWDFGDGNTSNVQNPLHTYNTPGTYDVSLTTT